MHDKFDDLMALHDKELSPEEQRKVEELLAEDAEARALLKGLAGADEAFKKNADELLHRPVPEKLLATVRADKPAQARVIPFPRRRGIVGLALAAGVAALVVFNTQVLNPPAGVESDAYAKLFQETLESTSSGDVRSSVDGSIQITPVVSFTTRERGYCREFVALRGDRELGGTACRRENGEWSLVSQQTFASVDDSGYRAAEGETVGEAPQLDRLRQLSFAEEQSAIKAGWTDSGL